MGEPLKQDMKSDQPSLHVLRMGYRLRIWRGIVTKRHKTYKLT